MDAELMRRTFDIARKCLENGDLPFGCLLTDADGNIIEEGWNTVVTSKDNIAHCEINLLHQLSGKYDTDYLHQCTLYAITEPCPMCSGAIYWSGIGRVIFAMSKNTYHKVVKTQNPQYIFDISCSSILDKGGRSIEVIGPVLEAEATHFYQSL
jgi:tRNA(Arg) A34 adenosine deaminase TadA